MISLLMERGLDMDWNDWLTLLNTTETVMVVIIFPLATERVIFWYRRLREWCRRGGDHAQAGQDVMAAPRQEDAEEDEGTR